MAQSVLYRIMRNYEETDIEGNIYVNMTWLKKHKPTRDINKAHATLINLEPEENVVFTVEEWIADADVLSKDDHIAGCRKQMDKNGLRDFSARCSCKEIMNLKNGTKIDPSEWKDEAKKALNNIIELTKKMNGKMDDDYIEMEFEIPETD